MTTSKLASICWTTALIVLLSFFGWGALLPLKIPTPRQAATKTSEFPRADSLIERALKLAGGRQAFARIDSIRAELMQVTDQGDISMELSRDRRGRFLLRQKAPQFGQVEVGFDGQTGWVNGAPSGGYQILEASAIAMSRRQVGLHFLLLEANDRFERLETVGRETLGGQEVYRVKQTPASENDEYAFFDVESGRLVAIEGNELKGVPVRRIFTEWQTFDGVELVTKMRVERGNTNWTLEFRKIIINGADAADFDLPEGVKVKLAEREKKDPSGRP